VTSGNAVTTSKFLIETIGAYGEDKSTDLCYDQANLTALGAPAGTETLAAVVNRWLVSAHGYDGIATVRREAAEIRSDVASAIETAETAQQKAAKKTCTATTTETVETANLIADNKELLRTLDDLIHLLDRYLARTWRNGNSVNSDLVIRNVGTDP